MKKQIVLIIACLSVLATAGCDGFLDAKPSKNIVIPETPEDIGSILDNTAYMNWGLNLAIVLGDDLYTTEEGWAGFRNDWEREAYIWKMDLSDAMGRVSGWNFAYTAIFHTNFVLERHALLVRERGEGIPELDKIRGSALFYRACVLLELSQVFAPPLHFTEDGEVPGIPLKLNTDIHERIPKSSLAETYGRIIADLEESANLLSERETFPHRPSKTAAYGMLSRIHLLLGNHARALDYAELTLSGISALMDYSELPSYGGRPLAQDVNPFDQFNKEVIFYSHMSTQSYITSALSYVDTVLYRSYTEGDLRKDFYFYETEKPGHANFRGNYSGRPNPFSGLATDEIYLIKSECLARLGEIQEAMGVLNVLLETRFVPGKFQPYTADSIEEALDIILAERRKELVFRGYLRWMDMRRLLFEGTGIVEAVRKINNAVYSPGTEWQDFQVDTPREETGLNPAL